MSKNRVADKPHIRDYVLMLPPQMLANLAMRIGDDYGVSRTTAHKYIREQIDDGVLRRIGLGSYELADERHDLVCDVEGLEEDVVWNDWVSPLVGGRPKNVIDILRFGCTEMVNNVIDHSGSDEVDINIILSPVHVEVIITDRGVGIFRKIAESLGLDDDRHAVLELVKGKMTTDPVRHTGEGIFFSSRAFDRFHVFSGGVLFSHDFGDNEDWITGDEKPLDEVKGTVVAMMMRDDSQTVLGEIFDKYAGEDDDYGFDKTIVPVKLMQYGDDELVSRSQAKRLMNRFDRFRTVILDFEGVPSIGQAFSDEVFRVYQTEHPELELIAIHANEPVARMINRALKVPNGGDTAG